MTNAAGTSYYHYDPSRAGAGARRRSGAHDAGMLCTDFYAGYNAHPGRHQRGWAHLLRDLADLEKTHGGVEEIAEWSKEVGALYKEGAAVGSRVPPPTAAAWEAPATELRGRAPALGLRGAQAKEHPTHGVGLRLVRHEAALFEFVRPATVAATNNRAERAMRPRAVARKISGGPRSAAGRSTWMRLHPLFTTWAAKGHDPWHACLEMLRAKTPLPSS